VYLARRKGPVVVGEGVEDFLAVFSKSHKQSE
jgi:hypothetical protein